VETTAPPGCPQCGVFAQRVHSRRRQRLRDLPVAGPVELVWVKRRWFCDQARRSRGAFSEVTDQVPAFARSTARLAQALMTAVVVSGRAVNQVARAHRLSWWLVQSMLSAAADLLTDPDHTPVQRLRVDEHRYRSVRFFREPDGGWWRYEPWMTTLVDADTGRGLGVVDGRDSAGVGAWLAARSQPWRDAGRWWRFAPSAAFRKALREHGGELSARTAGPLPQRPPSETPLRAGGAGPALDASQAALRHWRSHKIKKDNVLHSGVSNSW
jgi:transposase